MKTIIIAAAPVTKEQFRPVYAEFPITDSKLLECMGSYNATNEVLKAGCAMLGMEYSSCVTGMYYHLPDRENRPFELFIGDLNKRYRSARRDLFRQQEEEARKRNQTLFRVIMSL